jgi:hypothetical protein
MDQLYLIKQQDLDTLKNGITDSIVHAIKGMLGNFSQSNSIDGWVDDLEARKILGYKSKTKLQELRNHREIAFAKFGRKIRYQRSSLLNFLERHKKASYDDLRKQF